MRLDTRLSRILHSETSKCAIENSVNNKLNEAFSVAEEILLKRFQKLTLSEIAADMPLKHFVVHR